ncbi:MAG: hypothetical protein AAF985_22060, partial [Bacteroidota bacterium]
MKINSTLPILQILILVILASINTTIFAQNKGYIVTQDQKVNGEFFSDQIADYAKFRADTEKDYKEYTPSEISYLWVNNAKYESILIDGDTGKEYQFAEVLVEGKVNLYKVSDLFYLKK